MKFGYTIVYVSSVEETLAFYKEAFGFETRFLHESGQYGELETGETVLAFASHGNRSLSGVLSIPCNPVHTSVHINHGGKNEQASIGSTTGGAGSALA